MGSGNVRVPGKSGLIFDHILSRLQGELQKSRETGAELPNLTGAMNDIHDTLGGSLVSLSFRPLIHRFLNSCRSPPIYHLTHHHYPPFDPPLPKTPSNQPSNPHRPPHPFSQSSKLNPAIPSPASRATSTRYVLSRALSLSTTLLSMRPAPSGSSLRSRQLQRASAITSMDRIARKMGKKSSAACPPRSTMTIRGVSRRSFPTSWRGLNRRTRSRW